MTLRAGVIGIGVMGRHHSRVLAGLPGVDFVGVYDPAPNVPAAIEGKPVLSDLEEFLKLKPDYCVIAAPTIYHLELGSVLAANGIHALIEKPVASDSESALQLVNEFKQANLIGGVGHIERYNPALQSMRTRIADGQIGEIYQIATRRQGPFPGRIADVGVVKDLGTHDIDLTAWVTQQDYVSINARTTHRSGRPHEDMVVAVGTLSKGTIVSHLVNWLNPFKERTTIAIGEKGTLVADTLTADLTFYENGTTNLTWAEMSSFRGVSEGDITRYALEKQEPLLSEHIAFRDAINTRDQTGIVTLEQGLAVISVAEKIIIDSNTYQL